MKLKKRDEVLGTINPLVFVGKMTGKYIVAKNRKIFLLLAAYLPYVA